MKYRGISLHPFGSGQILNPYAPPLQQSRSLFIPFLYPLCHFSALRLRYLKYKEHIGLTKFRIINNCECLRRHLWAGRNHVHLLRRRESHRNHLRTFWCKCISLISLIPCNDSYNGSHYIRHSTLIL